MEYDGDDGIWNKGPELVDEEGEVRELTAEDFAKMIPFAQLPPELQETLLGIRDATFCPGPWPEEEVTIRLSRPVLARFRVTGIGWEGRVDEALRQWMEEHQAS